MRKEDVKKEKYIKVVGFSTPRGFSVSQRVVNPQENGMTQKKSWNDLLEESDGFKVYAKVFGVAATLVFIIACVSAFL